VSKIPAPGPVFWLVLAAELVASILKHLLDQNREPKQLK
jgi:hypothetical protein